MLIYKDSPFFCKETAKELFEVHRQNLDDTQGFDGLLENSMFWSVYDKGHFVGCIFVYEEEDKNWIGGYANRKHHKACVQALTEVCQMFDTLYAKTRHKTAVFCLKRSGFEFEDNRGNVSILRKEKLDDR